MAAVITDKLKKQLLTSVLSELADSNVNYYIGIGKSEEWNESDGAVTPTGSIRDVRLARYGLIALKAVIDYSFVAPRYTWSSGAIYSAWDDNLAGHPVQSYYVMNDENQIYVCLQQGKNSAGTSQPSVVAPTGSADVPFRTSDGYVWKFIFSIGAQRAAKFMAANFMPVALIDSVDSASTAAAAEQKTIQDAAIPKQIVGFVVTEKGAGYANAPAVPPSVTITGNGTRARGLATVDAGQVTKIELVDSSDNEIIFGRGYDFASVTIDAPPAGGTQATARAVFSPAGGFGADPRDDLRATAIMLNVKPAGYENKDFIIDNDFRQVVLMRAPKWGDSTGDYNLSTGSALKRMKLQSISSSFTIGNEILGSTSGAKALIDYRDSGDITFHQTEATGFLDFTEGEQITETNGNGQGVLQGVGFDADSDAFLYPDIDPMSGEILYIDNRAAIRRSNDQTEDIKVVIQL